MSILYRTQVAPKEPLENPNMSATMRPLMGNGIFGALICIGHLGDLSGLATLFP